MRKVAGGAPVMTVSFNLRLLHVRKQTVTNSVALAIEKLAAENVIKLLVQYTITKQRYIAVGKHTYTDSSFIRLGQVKFLQNLL